MKQRALLVGWLLLGAVAWGDPAELRSETVRPGAGTPVRAGQTVFIRYTATLTDGTAVAASSDDSPAEVHLGDDQVIDGLDQGITGMQVGELRRLTVPPELGFGAEGVGSKIPPNATLLYEVELLSVQPDPSPVEPEVCTASGLRRTVWQVGSGPAAVAGGSVTLLYTGRRANGRRFNATDGQAFNVELGSGQVVDGLEEGLTGVQAGEKLRLIIPAQLAYGQRGVPGLVDPGETLTFELDIVSVSGVK